MPSNDLEVLRKRLPKRAIAFLDAEDSVSAPTKFPTLLSIARYCHSAEMVFDEFHELVEESDLADTTSLLKGYGKALKACRSAWAIVDDHGDNEYPADSLEIRKLIGELIGRVEAHAWTGQTGGTDRQMAMSILGHCHELGTYSPVLSVRFLAERTTRGIGTVSRSLHRLIDAGLLARDGVTDQGNRQYRVDLRWAGSSGKGQNGTSSLVPSTCSTLSLQAPTPRHDAFVPRALGPAAGQIWVNQIEPATAAQVAVGFGLTTKTARRYLGSLVAVGLATKGQGRPAVFTMVEVPTERLDEIAAEFSATGWLERQKATHQNSREAMAIYRKQRERDSRPAVFQDWPSKTTTTTQESREIA